MSDQGSELAAALAVYRRETASANLAFFRGKIEALNRQLELNDQQRLDKLAPYFGLDSWSGEGYGSSITSPQQLLLSPGEPGYVDLGIHDDGTLSPQTEQVQAQYLDQLRSLMREAGGGDVPEPAEFIQLLTMTDAISDMDFRQSGSAGLHGTCEVLTRRDMSDRQSGQQAWYRNGWHVVTGWRCAYGNPGVTLLLYARKYDQVSTPDDEEFKWRVCT